MKKYELYRAAIVPRWRRRKNPLKPSDEDFEFGEPRTTLALADGDASRLDALWRAKVILIQKFDELNRQWFLHRILR